MSFFKVFRAISKNDLPSRHIGGVSYLVDEAGKDLLQWKVDVTSDSSSSSTDGTRKGIASEGLIYSNGEMVKPESITANVFSCVLATDSWSAVSGTGNFSQTISLSNIKCGKDGTIPPIIRCNYNNNDYNRIINADVNLDTHTITFTLAGTTAPTERIELTIIDF